MVESDDRAQPPRSNSSSASTIITSSSPIDRPNPSPNFEVGVTEVGSLCDVTSFFGREWIRTSFPDGTELAFSSASSLSSSSSSNTSSDNEGLLPIRCTPKVARLTAGMVGADSVLL